MTSDADAQIKPWYVRNQELSKLPRIRRGPGSEEEVFTDPPGRARLSRLIMVETKVGPVKFRYRSSRPHRMMAGDGVVLQRCVTGWIKIGKENVGALEFVEFDVDPLSYNDEFFETMDAESSVDAAVGEALCACWDPIGLLVSDHGTITEFRRAWMASRHARGSLWAPVAEAVIAKEFGHHAMLVMKAFPLEYEGRAPEGSPAACGLRDRQRAMIRHYRRLFGVETLPGWPGEEGWLWRPNPKVSKFIEAPKELQGR